MTAAPVGAAGQAIMRDHACVARSEVSFRTALSSVSWKQVVIGWLLAYVVGALIALLVYAAGWWDGAPWEHAALVRVNATVGPALDAVMLTLPLIGTNYTLAPLIAITAVLLWRRGYATVAVHLLVVQAGSWLLNPALKFSLPRDRPELFEARGQHAFPAFPSGHMIAVAAVLGTVAYLVHRCGRGTWAWWVVGAFFLLVGYSRLYLGVHWPMDVVGGTAVGLVWLWWTLRVLEPMHRLAVPDEAATTGRGTAS